MPYEPLTQEQIEAEAKVHSVEYILSTMIDITQMINETKEILHQAPEVLGEHIHNLEVQYADGRRLLAAKERAAMARRTT